MMQKKGTAQKCDIHIHLCADLGEQVIRAHPIDYRPKRADFESNSGNLAV
jgi:hypothetical protein